MILRFAPLPPPFPNPHFPHNFTPKTLTLTLSRAFYTERAQIPIPSPSPGPPEPDPISTLNDRIRRDLSRSGSGPKPDRAVDPREADKYIKLVKEQQQRGLMKLKGEREERSGYGYRVDPYTLRPGDYVVHKKVGIGRFVAIKFDSGRGEVGEPVEYVFIEYGDGMAKLPVKQAAKMLYRYCL